MSEPVSHRAPTDWKTDAMQKRIRKRYRAERRFRLIGLGAVVISAAFLFFLLATMIGNGAAGFMRTEVSLPIDFKSAPLEVDRAQLATRGADLALAGAGLEDRVKTAATAAFGAKGEELIAGNAWTAVRDAIKQDPNLLSQSTHIWVPASSELDTAADGGGEPEFRALVQQLRDRGALQSGFNADFQIDDAAEQAAFIHTKWQLGLKGGVVVSNPVPAAAAMPKEEIERITEQALAEADAGGVTGKAVTPFLLGRIKQLTDGRSLATNIALVMHNAAVGAALARAMLYNPHWPWHAAAELGASVEVAPQYLRSQPLGYTNLLVANTSLATSKV